MAVVPIFFVFRVNMYNERTGCRMTSRIVSTITLSRLLYQKHMCLEQNTISSFSNLNVFGFVSEPVPEFKCNQR